MPNFLDNLPEVFVSRSEISAHVNQAIKQGKLRKLGTRLYTRNLSSEPEEIIKRNWYHLLKDYYPDALIADRTAIENKPSKDGSIFIVSTKKRATKLPGITFKPRLGVGAIESDQSFIAGLRLSSTARAYLENMKVSRSRDGSDSRTLSLKEIEERLDKIIRIDGSEESLNQIRDQARRIAPELGLEKEFKKLDELIGSLLGTRDANLQSNLAQARRSGSPFDPERKELFIKLFEELKNTAPTLRSSELMTSSSKVNLSFFESYFSNFIEGTEFEVQEAVEIVFEGKIPSQRPEDAHDVLGTYRIVSDYSEMSKLPKKINSFLQLLKSRHLTVMQARPDKNPGKFKTKRNQAGATQFVSPEMVEGSLKIGFELYQALTTPLHRAIYMMFLISEVHPFTDGNGRVARIMMNAELVNSQEQKIIIPTVYRNNYISALKALSHNARAEPLIRTLDFAQRYTQSIDWENFKEAQKQLEQSNAFLDPNDAEDRGIRLKIIS